MPCRAKMLATCHPSISRAIRPRFPRGIRRGRMPGEIAWRSLAYLPQVLLLPCGSWLGGSVRLPKSVRHRRMSFGFPMRPEAVTALGEPGISRFPREVSAYVHGVSDRPGLWRTSRYRCTRWGLPLLLTASASRRKDLSRLNTRSARSPVNASTPLLGAAPHDSGPMWVASHIRVTFSFTTPRRLNRRTRSDPWSHKIATSH